MPLQEKIRFLNARFACRETEAAYLRSTFRRNLISNLVGIAIFLSMFVLGMLSELVDSADPQLTLTIRVVAIVIVLCLLSTLFHPAIRFYQNVVVTTCLIVAGGAMNIILFVQPGLNNNYYIGLIQGFIIISLLLRLSFEGMAAMFALTLATFCLVAFGKGDPHAAALQSVNLAVVGVFCLVGIYVIQRLQRVDFLKSRKIEEQNASLAMLLKAAERSNERKVAALNLLVHFVKTPLHQISGFSELLVSSLSAREDKEAAECADNARYIRSATSNLSKSVNSLLAYHRLDETDGAQRTEEVDSHGALVEFAEYAPEGATVRREKPSSEVYPALRANPDLLRTALKSLAAFYAEADIDEVDIMTAADERDGVVQLRFVDNAPPLSAERFAEDTKPLTDIEGYLTTTGEPMPMTLRMTARAADIAGGVFRHEPSETGNIFILEFNIAAAAAAA